MSTSITSATGTGFTDTSSGANPNGILGKDDFMKLLLVELQHQDPTEPMDSEKILSQTSQLATLEASDNTNKALEKLATSLGSNLQFSTIAAIGKTADLGTDAVAIEEGQQSAFDLYFPTDAQNAYITITDNDGNEIKTINAGDKAKGIYQFEWDGKLSDGSPAEAGLYHINATYTDMNGAPSETRLGLYPIESVRFDGEETLVKLGSDYVPFEAIKEVFGG